MSEATETPLVDLLRGVPLSARAIHEFSEMESLSIPYGRMCHEAADEIDRLRKENAALRGALERIADPRNTHFAGDAQVVARAALQGAKDD